MRTEKCLQPWWLGRAEYLAGQGANPFFFSHLSRISRGTGVENKNRALSVVLVKFCKEKSDTFILLSHISQISRGIPGIVNFIFSLVVWLIWLIWLKTQTSSDDFRLGLTTLVKLAGDSGYEQK